MGSVCNKELQENTSRHKAWGELKRKMGRKQEKQVLLMKMGSCQTYHLWQGIRKKIRDISILGKIILVYKLKYLMKVWVDNTAYVFNWLIYLLSLETSIPETKQMRKI